MNKIINSGYKINYGDIYVQFKYIESYNFKNNKFDFCSYIIDSGLSVRFIDNEKTFFSYSNLINKKSLCSNIVNIFNELILNNLFNKDFNFMKDVIDIEFDGVNLPYCLNKIPYDVSVDEKINILYKINDFAKSIDSKVYKVDINLIYEFDSILIFSTDNNNMLDNIKPLIKLVIKVYVKDLNKIELSVGGGGGSYGYDILFSNNKNSFCSDLIDIWVHDVVRSALINLSAIDTPCGLMTVVLGKGWPGILLHESIGHGLEGDFNRKKVSLFYNKINKKIASELCTIVDNGTLVGKRGSILIDDEGVVSKNNILVENGVLKKFMLDKLNANLMGLECTGNGRRESYSCLPIPRMTNTYMLPGNSTKDDIISSVDYGIYATNFCDGEVDITSGKFVFTSCNSFLIKNGNIVCPVKSSILIGYTTEIMNNISMVGNDLMMDNGIGTCIKDGQSIPVSVGQPTIKIDKITVGGNL